MKRIFFKLTILIFSIVVFLGIGTSCAGHSYDGVATAYLNAFQRFDYKTMYDLLTPGSQGTYDYEEFVE